jgi:hypothetical protein
VRRSAALAALAGAALACGVKAPPRPPLREKPDAGAPSQSTKGSTSLPLEGGGPGRGSTKP